MPGSAPVQRCVLGTLMVKDFAPTPFQLCREEESTEVHGHITSLAVARTHRKLGLATKLMSAAREHSLDQLITLQCCARSPLVCHHGGSGQARDTQHGGAAHRWPTACACMTP